MLFYLNINCTSEPQSRVSFPLVKIAVGVFPIVYFGLYEKKVETWPDEVA